MGIFTRFRDIVSANLSAMLDKAEDPEKLIRLMIQEMEETLVELKASCARTMAETARIARERDLAAERADMWSAKALLAVEKGREDLAREALMEKKDIEARVFDLEAELAEHQGMVEACKADIVELEEKLVSAKERRRTLVARARRAKGRASARGELRRAMSSDTLVRFEEFERRIERLEAEAELAGPYEGRRRGRDEGDGDTLEEKFARIETDADIERQLADLREKTRAGARDRSGQGA